MAGLAGAGLVGNGRTGALLRGAGLMALCAALAVPANAQTAAASAPPTAAIPESVESGNSNEIVVTARRSEERLQDVPIAVSVVTAQDLRRQALDDLGDIAEKTVGFAFETFTGPLAQPVIRGQTNLRTTSPVQNVATYLNGIYLQRGYFIDQGLLDLKRVEIIKGPQSALYGRNAFAGVINITTNGADLDKTTGRVSGTVGNHDRYDGSGSVNLVLIDGKLAIYGAAAHSEFDGTWRNNHPLADADGGFTKGNVGGYNKESYQVGVKAKLAEGFTVEASYIRTERELEQNAAYTLTTAGLTYNFNSLNASPTGTGAARQNRLYVGKLETFTVNAPGETRLPGLVIDPRSYGLRGPTEIIIAKAMYEFGDGLAMSYLFGHTKAKINARGSSARDPLLPTVAFGTNFGVIFDSSGNDSDFTSDSHEAKFAFTLGDRFSGFLGGNYTTTSDDESNGSEFAPVNSLTPPNPASFFPLGPGLPIPTTLTFRRNTYLQRNEKVFSIFGYLDWRPTDRLALTLEGRWTSENQKAADLLAAGVGTPAIIAPVTPETTREATFFTPRASVTYKITPSNNVYASVARGYKSGGLNGVAATFNSTFTTQLTPGTLFAASQQTYEAETNYTYEIGTKNSFMDGRLTLNGALFYTDWKNLQSNAVRLQPNGTPPTSFAAIVPSVIGNLGDVEVYGAEIEGNFRLTNAIRVNFGAAYNHARYRDGTYSQRFGASGNCDGIVCAYTTAPGFSYPVLSIAGNQLERTPEFDALAGVTYETTFNNGWDFFARADVTYQTKQFADEANLAFVPDRTLVNASTGLTVGNFSAQVWVKNLFDKEYVSNALFLIGTGGAGSASYVPILGDKRTFGLTGSFSF